MYTLRWCLCFALLSLAATQKDLPEVPEFATDCPDKKLSLDEVAERFNDDLSDKVIPFLLNNAAGTEGPNGTSGYTLAYNTEGPFNSTTRQLATQARTLYTFAHLYNEAAASDSELEKLLTAADAGYEFLEKYFFDSIFGGYVWMVSDNGTVVRAEKNARGQFAVILAYVEYSRAKKDITFAERAQELYNNISRRLQDTEFGGYTEDFRANWMPIRKPRGEGPTGSYGLKTQPFVIEFLQALTELFIELEFTNVEIAIENLLDDEVPNFFLPNPAKNTFSFLRNGRQFSVGGANAFGTYLAYINTLIKAEKAIGRDPSWKTFARYMQFVIDEGILDGGVMDSEVRVWWATDNMIEALATAMEEGRGEQYRKELIDLLHFELCYLIDSTHGMSIWSVNDEGEPRNTLILAPWKSGFHEVRAKTSLIRAALT